MCRLKGELYGPKQAPRAWHTMIENYFTRLAFAKSEEDANIYHIVVDGKILITVVYVDVLIFTGDEQLITSCKEDLAREFEIKDIRLLHYFLGLEIWKRYGDLFISQGNHAKEIMRKFHMEGRKTMETPLAGNWRKEGSTLGEVADATIYRQLVASLMYLVNTRTDIRYVVNQLSQVMVKLTKIFWKAGKNVLRYIRGTT